MSWNNKIRLIDVSGSVSESSGEFIGFVYGILSQDHDLEQMYLDSFLKISLTDAATANDLLRKLDKISEKFSVTLSSAFPLERRRHSGRFEEVYDCGIIKKAT